VPWLLGLGAAVVVFNIGFEAVWLYLYRGRQLLRTLTGEFTLDADFFTPVPASLQLLALVLAVPLLMLTLRGKRRARIIRLSAMAIAIERHRLPVSAVGVPVAGGAAVERRFAVGLTVPDGVAIAVAERGAGGERLADRHHLRGDLAQPLDLASGDRRTTKLDVL